MGYTIPPLFHCYGDDERDGGGEDRLHFERRVDALGISIKRLHVGASETLRLNLSGTTISDLSPLRALPLTHLCLQGCYRIADFSPLAGMCLTWLNL